MRHRLLAALLAALPFLPGCVILDDPIALALSGPRLGSVTSPAMRQPEPQERMALLLLDPGEEAAALGACIARGMRARLPAQWPPPERPEAADAAAGLAAIATMAERDGVVHAAPIETGYAWLVAVRDRSTAGAEEEAAERFARPGSIGVGLTHVRRYRLALEAQLFDLRAAQFRGRLTAEVDTRSRSGVAVGVFAGVAGILPLALPLIEVPAGTSALAICDAFGRAVAEALAGVPPAAAEPAPPPR